MLEINKTNLQKSIKETVLWFSFFDYPLTSWEIYKFLPCKARFHDVNQALLQGIENVESKNGLYFIKGQSPLTKERQKRYNYSDRKYKKALMLAHCFRYLPWIKMMAVANLMGSHNLRDQGDIDLFIVTSTKRIWLTRFVMAGVLKILNLRPAADDYQDTFCLSFFVTDESLSLENLRLNNDLYFRYWLASLIPIYNVNNCYDKLINANNWLKTELPNWQQAKPGSKRIITAEHKKNSSLNILDGLETTLRNWQIKHLPKIIKQILNIDTKVVANSNIIKLHSNDRRQLFIDRHRTSLGL